MKKSDSVSASLSLLLFFSGPPALAYSQAVFCEEDAKFDRAVDRLNFLMSKPICKHSSDPYKHDLLAVWSAPTFYKDGDKHKACAVATCGQGREFR